MIALVGANVLGLAGFLWPLLLGVPQRGAESGAHASDAPVLLALLVPLLLWVAIDEARGRGGDARLIALLATLVAINAFLRIPKGPTGEGLVFVLPILCGWWVGARFAFLLGAFTMFTSALLTGGVGPWMPFQMFALGWVGAGAGIARRVVRGRFPVPVLAGYAYVSSLGYGFVMSLWFWPFFAGDGPLFYADGLSVADALTRYARFWTATSLPWDTGRALLTNVPLVAILARPVGTVLVRARDRFTPRFVPWTLGSEPDHGQVTLSTPV